jgi:hypothetical protein
VSTPQQAVLSGNKLDDQRWLLDHLDLVRYAVIHGNLIGLHAKSIEIHEVHLEGPIRPFGLQGKLYYTITATYEVLLHQCKDTLVLSSDGTVRMASSC